MKKSVCIATYNGSKYIQKQLSSILEQFEDDDEVIIVDDASLDDTAKIIDDFKDARIKLIQNHFNLGVVKNFEKAIENSSHEIIFLSDQDDVWLPQKVKKITEAFEINTDVTLITSDAKVIDKNSKLISESFYQFRGRFVAGIILNILKNNYLGCTLAFRRKMLQYFLPFPRDIPMHDMWIGILNDIYGKTLYINEPLIHYRIHGENLTNPLKHSSIQNIIKWRYSLIKSLLLSIISHRLK